MSYEVSRVTRAFRLIVPVLAATLMMGSAAFGHHSFVMFDAENPITIRGKVIEYKFANPHAFIFLNVADDKGVSTKWSLEGASAASLVRAGWSGTSLKPGDEVIMKIAPLRSGAPGGAWEGFDTTFADGQPVVKR